MVALDAWPSARHRHTIASDGPNPILLGDRATPSPTVDGPLAENVTRAADRLVLLALADGGLCAASRREPC